MAPEHVIVDGASTDGTEALISKLAKSRPYVKLDLRADTGQSSNVVSRWRRQVHLLPQCR